MADEYIKRKYIFEALEGACAECRDACGEFDGIYPDCNECLLHGTMVEVKRIPSEDVAPVKRGKWMFWSEDEPNFYSCDICGFHNLLATPYCPNCGSKMSGGNDG